MTPRRNARTLPDNSCHMPLRDLDTEFVQLPHRCQPGVRGADGNPINPHSPPAPESARLREATMNWEKLMSAVEKFLIGVFVATDLILAWVLLQQFGIVQ